MTEPKCRINFGRALVIHEQLLTSPAEVRGKERGIQMTEFGSIVLQEAKAGQCPEGERFKN